MLALADKALDLARIRPKDLDALAVCIGPGSFTGLRIGISTAKGLAMALDLPAVGVSSLEALAFQAQCPAMTICPVIDARRGELFFAQYRPEKNGLTQISPPAAARPQQLLKFLSGPCFFIGTGAGILKKHLPEKLGMDHVFAHDHAHFVKGSGILAAARLQHPDFPWTASPNDLLPAYIRKPDAKLPANARMGGL